LASPIDVIKGAVTGALPQVASDIPVVKDWTGWANKTAMTVGVALLGTFLVGLGVAILVSETKVARAAIGTAAKVA
jgi:hypothetical protein